MGDLNADLGSSYTPPNEQGKILKKFIERWSYVSLHLINQPHPFHTYESEAHRSRSTIDHILCPTFLSPHLITSFVLPDHPLNLSDHHAVYASLALVFPASRSLRSGHSSPVRRPVLVWSRLDSQTQSSYSLDVASQLANLSLSLSSSEDINKFTLTLTGILVSSAQAHVPSSIPRPHVRPNWSPVLKQLHALSKHKYRTWCNAGSPSNPSHPLKLAYKEAKRAFRREFRTFRRSEAESFYNSLDPSNPRIFQLVRSKLNRSSKTTSHLKVGTDSYQGTGLPEGWATYFESLYTPNSSGYDSPHQSFINDEIRNIISSPDNVCDNIMFSPEDIQSLIQDLPKRKACGPDALSMEHFIYAPPFIYKILSTLFNAMVHLHHVPPSFCNSLIIPIHKGGNKDPADPGSYRGISLSSNLSKLFERALLQVLHPRLLPIIHHLQGGFRPGFSTAHSSFILSEAIFENKIHKLPSFLAFLDVRKAFDTVWHAGLFYKLFHYGVRGNIWFVLFYWYSRLSASVLWNGSVSRPLIIAQGVRQGAVLSPLLYAVFTSDLLVELESSGHGVYIDTLFCGAPTFADDMSLIANSPFALQAMLDIISSYTHKWRYSINSSKSQVLILGNCQPPISPWKVCNKPIPVSESAKHLGILISSRGSTIDRTLNAISNSRSAFYALTAVGARQSCMSPTTALHLFKSLSLSIMAFGYESWAPSNMEIMMMERSQLKILRTILGCPVHSPSKGIHLLLGTLPVKYLLDLRHLMFTRSLLALPSSATARKIFMFRSRSIELFNLSISSMLIGTLDRYNLPSVNELDEEPPSKLAWKALTKALVHEAFRDSCTINPGPTLQHILQLPLLKYGRPSQLLSFCSKSLSLARLSNLRIRLLLHATSLRAHTSRFRVSSDNDRNPNCNLCHLAQPENALHFIAVCPALTPIRRLWVPMIFSSPPTNQSLFDHVMGFVWIPEQDLLLRFLADLYHYRSILLP